MPATRFQASIAVSSGNPLDMSQPVFETGTTGTASRKRRTRPQNRAANPTAKQSAKLQTLDGFHRARNSLLRSTVRQAPNSSASRRAQRELRETAARRKRNIP